MARTGLRMMPTFPSPPLKFRTAGFPQYGFKASLSDRAFLQARNLKPAPGIPVATPQFACTLRPLSPQNKSWLCVQDWSGFHQPLCERPPLSTPGVLGSGSSCVVSIHHRLLRPHPPVSPARCDFTSLLLIYAAPSLCGSAAATHETFPTFTAVLSTHAADPTPVVPRAFPLCSHVVPGFLGLSSSRLPTKPVSASYHSTG